MPFVLDLLRHGAALPAFQGGDETRRLSPRGRADLERLAGHLAATGWRPDRAFASPLVRAQESAAITLGGLTPPPPVERMEALSPDTAPMAVLEALAVERATQGHVLLVGHQPLLGLLGGTLTGGSELGFAPGTMVRLEFSGAPAPGAGVMRWHLPPGFAA